MPLGVYSTVVLYNKSLVDAIRSSLTLDTIYKSTETLQIFTIHNKTVGVYKVIKNAKLESLGGRPVGLIKEGRGSHGLKVICRVAKWEQRALQRRANIYNRSKSLQDILLISFWVKCLN